MNSPARTPSLAVISGPSGSGKTTLVRRLVQEPGFRRAITATTRAPRPDEVDGKAYHFRTREAFAALRDRGELAEWAEVHGEWYGTPRAELAPRPGATTLLDVDVQGFRTLRRTGIPFLSVFVAPPSIDELRRRLEARGTETREQIDRRIARARVEMEAAPEYEHVVVNHAVEEALAELRGLLAAPAGTT